MKRAKKKLSLIIGLLNVTLLRLRKSKPVSFSFVWLGFDGLTLWLSYILQINKPTAPYLSVTYATIGTSYTKRTSLPGAPIHANAVSLRRRRRQSVEIVVWVCCCCCCMQFRKINRSAIGKRLNTDHSVIDFYGHGAVPEPPLNWAPTNSHSIQLKMERMNVFRKNALTLTRRDTRIWCILHINRSAAWPHVYVCVSASFKRFLQTAETNASKISFHSLFEVLWRANERVLLRETEKVKQKKKTEKVRPKQSFTYTRVVAKLTASGVCVAFFFLWRH